MSTGSHPLPIHRLPLVAAALLLIFALAGLPRPANAGPMQSAQQFIYFGNKALDKGDWDEAEQEYRYAVAYSRRHHDDMLSESYAHLAEVYLYTGRVTRAQETLAVALRLTPNESDGQRLQTLLTNDPQLNGVRQRIQAQVDKNPNNAEAKAILASLSLRAEKYDDAKSLAEEALKEDPKEVHAMAILAQLLVRDGKDADARQLFEEAIRHDKENDHLFGSLGEIALRQKDVPAAVHYLKTATLLAPEHHRWHELLANAYDLAGDKVHADLERQTLATEKP